MGLKTRPRIIAPLFSNFAQNYIAHGQQGGMGGSSAAIGPTENRAICSKTAAKRIAFLIICFSCAFHSKIFGPAYRKLL